MRVCYVSRECSPYTSGGIGTYIHNVLQAMSKRGHQVTLVSDLLDGTAKKRAKAELEASGIRVILPEALPVDLAGCFYHPNHEYAERVYRTLRTLMAEHPFDVVEFPEYRAEGVTCIRSKRLSGEFDRTALVVKCHTPTSLLQEINNQHTLDEETYYAIYLEDYSVRHADIVASPSQSLGDYYKRRLGVHEVKPSPYPLHLPEIDARLGSPTRDSHSLVFVGRLEWRKGVDLLVMAANQVLRAQPMASLHFYGEDTPTGPFETSMLSYLKRRCVSPEVADRMHFHGQVPYHEALRQIASAGVCVFPSRWENWPNVCLEAMSFGVPVVASRNGGMAEMVVDGQSGFVVDPDDSEALSDRIIRLLADPTLARSIGLGAAKRAKKMADYEASVSAIEQSYVCKARRMGPISVRSPQPMVSVIVPFYNQGNWLREAIRSVLQSNYSPVEVIIVDDGSTDPSSRRVFDAMDDPRIRKVRKSNGGLGSARNAGLRAATGEFILPLDSDDRIDPGYIAAAVQALEKNPELGYVTCYVRNFGALENHYVPLGFVREVLLHSNPAGKCCSLFRRQVLEELHGYDETMISFEDWELLCRLASTGWDGDVLPHAYFYYRRHRDSMVYRTALPRQSQLMSYMARKNTALLEKYGRELHLLSLAHEFPGLPDDAAGEMRRLMSNTVFQKVLRDPKKALRRLRQMARYYTKLPGIR